MLQLLERTFSVCERMQNSFERMLQSFKRMLIFFERIGKAFEQMLLLVMQHLESLFTLTAEADRVLCQFVMFLTVFFHWMYKMKFSCYQESSVIHG